VGAAFVLILQRRELNLPWNLQRKSLQLRNVRAMNISQDLGDNDTQWVVTGLPPVSNMAQTKNGVYILQWLGKKSREEYLVTCKMI
jgi:hypothetical protein